MIYVNQAAAGANDGTSWVDAFGFLQDALAVASDGDDVWIAEGVYKPDRGASQTLGDRRESFVLSSPIRLLGGFTGTEDSPQARPGNGNRTILSGDLLGDDMGNVRPETPSRRDNSFHVLRIEMEDSTAFMDGLTISDGNASSDTDQRDGGGVLSISGASISMSAVEVRNCSSIGFGGGMYVFGGEIHADRLSVVGNYARGRGAGVSSFGATVRMSGSQFRDNHSDDWGGGLYHSGQSTAVGISDVAFVSNTASLGGGFFHRVAPLVLVNARFFGNRASSEGGGLAVNDASQADIANVVLAGNHADQGGGGILLSENGEVSLTGLTMTHNTASRGPASLWSFYTQSTIVNTIAWPSEGYEAMRFEGNDRPRLGSSIVRGGLPGFAIDLGGVVDYDPLFIDAVGQDGVPGTSDDNLSLRNASPAIDSGDETFLPPDSFDLDEDGNPFEPLPVDLAGSHRLYDHAENAIGLRLDIGAFEAGSPAVSLGSPHQAAPRIELELELYPQPVGNTLFVRPTRGGNPLTSLVIFDVLGRVVATIEPQPGHAGSLPIDTSHLRPGVYFLRARQAHRSLVTSFIVTN